MGTVFRIFLFAGTLLFPLVDSGVFGFQDGNIIAPPQPQIPTIAILPMENRPYKVDLGAIQAGKAVRKQVIILNHTNSEVSLVGVEKSCSCSSANVPNQKLAPGESVSAQFNLEVESHPRSVEQFFSVTILTNSGPSHLVLTFRGHVDDYVGFRERSIIRSVGLSQGNAEIETPLIISNNLKLSKISCRVDSTGRTVPININNGIYSVVIPVYEAFDSTETQRLSLYCGDQLVDSVPVQLLVRPPVEVLPKRLIFTPSSEKGIFAVAHGLIRIKSTDSEPIANISAARCLEKTTSNPLSIDTHLEKIRDGVYRVEARVLDSGREESFDAIKWEFLSDSGAFYADSLVFFSNL